MHLLIMCRAKSCKEARRKFIFVVIKHAYTTSADLGDFLAKRLKMTPSGQLVYNGAAHAAYGLVTGFLPTDLIMRLRQMARTEEGDVSYFMRKLRTSCSRLLWWPTWSAARNATHTSTEDDTGYISVDTDDEVEDYDDADI